MVDYLEIGLITNTHGLKGEMKVKPFTKQKERYAELEEVWIASNTANKTENKAYKIESVRYQKDMVLLKLKGIDTIEVAETLKNHEILLPREKAQALKENEYFIADLIGCEVFRKGETIGTVSDVFTAGASDVYVIKRKGKKDLLLPALKSVVQNVDIDNKKIEVEIPGGLEDEI